MEHTVNILYFTNMIMNGERMHNVDEILDLKPVVIKGDLGLIQ